MGLMLKTQRDGTLRAEWYGVYTDNGRRKVVNLDVKWAGTPPKSGRVGDDGDPAFEKSREAAEAALASIAEKSSHKGRAEHLVERLIESKTGRAVEYARLDALPDLWRTVGREVACVEKHLENCDARFRRFVDFMHATNKAAVYLYEVTAKDAAAFVATLQTGKKQLARSTARATVRLVNAAFNRFLPVGVANPFAAFIGRRGKQNVEAIHRRPLTAAELQRLFDLREDDFMHPLVVTAACSGMRRGDVCGLKWADVDLAGGMVTVKTSKTGEAVEIPIFGPLRGVLENRHGKGKGFVFPEAAAMLRDNPQGLSYRFKTFLVRALSDATPAADLPQPTPAAEIEDEGAAAIVAKIHEGTRRDRTLDTFRRYCAGESVRAIHKATGRPKPTISYDLHTVEDIIGKPFMRSGQAPGVKADIARMTRAPRQHGQKAASILDWHALRTTWVTLALSAGIPLELVRRVTGHATVEIVLKHYFRPGREQFKNALAGAMPAVLTGGTAARMKPADELAALAGKVAAGTANETDKKRLRLLAAKV